MLIFSPIFFSWDYYVLIFEKGRDVCMKKICAVKSKLCKVANECSAIAYGSLAQCDAEKRGKVTRKTLSVVNAILAILMISCMAGTVFAGAAEDVLQQMINIICKVFKYVGVVLAVYSIGQLVMAFKNEDADSKSRATTMLVVACVLVGIDALVKQTNLSNYLK